MIQLLVIADDFTGALDTGIQFQAKGTRVLVGPDSWKDMAALTGSAQVLIADAETRHMAPEEAFRTVSAFVKEAVRLGIPRVYKKTDSALRGNVGAELAAALEASGLKRLHFVPAFPSMGRTTVGGIHRIDGVPVAESAFRDDPFNPVTCSSVADILKSQTESPVTLVEKSVPAGAAGRSGAAAGAQRVRDPGADAGILVYDAETDEDLQRIAGTLAAHAELHLLAGCAGFASVLPELLDLEREEEPSFRRGEGFFFLCGSVNRTTVRQVEYAAERGFRVLSLSNSQKLNPAWSDGGIGNQALSQLFFHIPERYPVIVESFSDREAVPFRDFAAERGFDAERIRVSVSDSMGRLLKALLDLGLRRTFMVTGGDTLLAFMRAIGSAQLEPVTELLPGVVLSRVRYRGDVLQIISKSGGFGDQKLLPELNRLLS